MRKLLYLLFFVLSCSKVFSEERLNAFYKEGFIEKEYKEISVENFHKKYSEAEPAAVKNFNNLKFKTKCHFVYCDFTEDGIIVFYENGAKGGLEWNGEQKFPKDLKYFTALELYFHLESYYYEQESRWCFREKLDGWKILDDICFINQKYAADENLKVRNSPSLKGEQTGLISKGEMVTVLEIGEPAEIDNKKSAWVKIKTKNNLTGWCFAGYLGTGHPEDYY